MEVSCEDFCGALSFLPKINCVSFNIREVNQLTSINLSIVYGDLDRIMAINSILGTDFYFTLFCWAGHLQATATTTILNRPVNVEYLGNHKLKSCLLEENGETTYKND